MFLINLEGKPKGAQAEIFITITSYIIEVLIIALLVKYLIN